MKLFNRGLNSGFAYRKYFPGAKSDDIADYCLRTLRKEKYDVVVIHAGTNSLFNEDIDNIANEMNDVRIKNINRLIVAHLNINQIIGKFNSLQEIIQGYLDILAISESKLYQSNPTSMFDIVGYTQPFRRGRNNNGGGILVYVREGIPCRELKVKPGAENLEGLFIEINLRKNKWILFAGYNNCLINIGTNFRPLYVQFGKFHSSWGL